MRPGGAALTLTMLVLACVPEQPEIFPRLEKTGATFQGSQVGSTNLRDRLWDVPCSFNRTSDGKLRCLPTDSFDESVVFLDSACASPVTRRPRGLGSEKFSIVELRPGESCEPRFDLFRRGDEARMAATFERRMGVCAPNRLGSVRVFPLTRNTAEAVEGVLVRGPAKEGLSAVYLQAQGQTLWIDGWHDERLDTACDFIIPDPIDFRARTGGLVRCWPKDLLASETELVFADTSCNLPAVRERDRSCGGAGRFAVLTNHSRECPTPMRAVRLRGSVGLAFTMEGGVCRVDAPLVNALVLGDEIPSESLPKGELMVPESPSRIRPAVITTAVEQISTLDLWDQDLDHFCTPGFLENGQLRCIPTDLAFIDELVFADPSCTQRLGRSKRAEEGCHKAMAGRFAGDKLEALFRLGEAHAGPFFALRDGACVERPADPPDPLAFFLATEIPLERLAPLGDGRR